jgi:signal transduction histidine kinase
MVQTESRHPMLRWLTASSPAAVRVPPDAVAELLHTREQIVTALLRIAALLGAIALVVTLPDILVNGRYALLAGYVTIVALTWALAINRQIGYRLRGVLIVIATYLLALNELAHFGYSVDAVIYLAGFALLPLAFLGWRTGAAALAISVVTLALIGWAQVGGVVAPPPVIISACLSFAMVIGSVQAGMSALLRSLEVAWTREREARAQLERAHAQLELRVAERTAELAAAHQATIAANRTIAAQNRSLSALHEATIDLLNHRALSELLQAIVDQAAAILEAPYGELMTHDPAADALVVRAFTANQPFLLGDQARRGDAPISWRAFDTQQPVVINDYGSLATRRDLYDPIPLTSVADFPILASGATIGVLAIGRGAGGQPFTPTQIQQGQLFAQLCGLVLENARLYDLALSEIAERTQAEQSLRAQTDLLNAQNAELDAFAHTVAHDLTTPLVGLIGYADLLQMSVLRGTIDDLPQHAEVVASSGRKMVQIINELLLLARVRKQSDVPSNRLAMGAIVRDAELRLAHQIAAAQATITRPEVWPEAIGYAPWIEEVWANYISNAIKYGGPKAQITLGAEPTAQGHIRFWVRDTGMGLSAAQQARLFTAFTRLHTARAEGHGLGLSIVQRIIAKLGGEVGVESELGRGACFFFTLPMADPPEPEHT